MAVKVNIHLKNIYSVKSPVFELYLDNDAQYDDFINKLEKTTLDSTNQLFTYGPLTFRVDEIWYITKEDYNESRDFRIRKTKRAH